MIKVYAAFKAGGELEAFEFDLGPLGGSKWKLRLNIVAFATAISACWRMGGESVGPRYRVVLSW